MTQEERRIMSAVCRALTSSGDEQCRALDRIQSLAGEAFAWDVWLHTKPDPEIVEQVITHRLLRASPLHYVLPVQKLTWLADTVKVNRSISAW